MEKDLVTYKITIDPEFSDSGEDLGIEQIAFVASPAVLTKGYAFDTSYKDLKFTDEKKLRIVAPALIPMDIYRKDDWGEYFVQFTTSEIEKIHSKFMKTLDNKKVFNLEHNSGTIAPAFILEAWLVGKDPKADRSYSEFGISVPSGSLMVVSQITDKSYYDELIKNEQVGFSIEGFLGLKLTDIINKNKFNMELNDKVKELEIQLADALSKLAEATKTEKTDEEIKTETTEVEDTKLVDDTTESTTEDTTTTETKTDTEESVLNPDEIMAIVQPKIDELMAIIAELQAKMEDDMEEDTVEMVPVEMSFSQKLQSLTKAVTA